jgi:hypothetical protein
MRRTKKTTHRKKTITRGAPNKLLSRTLYTYVRPVNDRWVRTQARKRGVAYSVLLDRIISHARNHA